MFSRRGFLIGTGGLLTMAFVSDARASIRRKEAPLLVAPPRRAHTLYWDWPDGLEEPQLCLDGEPEVIAPEPPTWRVFLKSLDAKDYDASHIKRHLQDIGFEPSQLDEEMDASWWETHYDRISGPSAKAYRLLEEIDLGPDLGRRGDGPHLDFVEGGGKPTAPASPWQNGFVERLIGSIRRECVDHIIVLGEMHLRRVLKS